MRHFLWFIIYLLSVTWYLMASRRWNTLLYIALDLNITVAFYSHRIICEGVSRPKINPNTVWCSSRMDSVLYSREVGILRWYVRLQRIGPLQQFYSGIIYDSIIPKSAAITTTKYASDERWFAWEHRPVPCRHHLIRHLLTSCPNKTRPHYNPIATFLSWEIATSISFLWLEASTLIRSYACPTFGKICQISIYVSYSIYYLLTV